MTKRRPDYSGHVVHAMNRRVDRQTLFTCDSDYVEFRDLIGVARDMFDIQLLEWVLMPNHFHFLLHPETKNQLSDFMGWLCLTHAKNWRERTETVGEGALYQDRYKAFAVKTGRHLHRLRNYLAMNPVEANLVRNPWEWKWGSAKRAKYQLLASDIKLSDGPEPHYGNLAELLFTPWNETDEEKERLMESMNRETPFGDDLWRDAIIEDQGLQHTIRKVGRPKKGTTTITDDQLWILQE
jgi:putative transposase